MIKNMFISVTKAKLSGVEDFYWFLNTSKKIEEFFGIMRSFAGGNPNFDSLELRNRAEMLPLVIGFTESTRNGKSNLAD